MIDAIRNVTLISKNGCGKTSFMEAVLYNTGKTNRIGKVDNGNTLLDSEQFEIDKKMSIYSKLVNLEWNKTKLNILDTPGYVDFCGEVYGCAYAADQIMMLVDAAEGINNQVIANIDFTNDFKKPRFILVNKFDREDTSFDDTYEKLCDAFGSDYILFPAIIPGKTGANFDTVINLLNDKSYKYKDDLGNFSEEDIPAEFADMVESYKEKIMEAAAEKDDELMDKYLTEGTLSEDEIKKGLKLGLKSGKVIPVISCSSLKNVGVKQVLDFMVNYGLSPKDTDPFVIKHIEKDEEKEENSSSNELHAVVFKIFQEAGLGDLIYVRLFSGKLTPNSMIFNITTNKKEKIGSLCKMIGKKREEVETLTAGDMGAILKMKNTYPGNILTSENSTNGLLPITYPIPVIYEAVLGKEKKDQEKLGEYLTKYAEVDPTFSVKFDAETGQTIIYGMGTSHLQLVLSKLKGIDFEMQKPKVHYRETITKPVVERYRHKKQSGGKGQFGEVEIEIKPLKLNSDKEFEFIDAIVGGVVPAKYIGPTERGIVDATKRGVIAGYPVIYISCKLQDGKFHDVDSSDLSFQIAGSKAFQNGAKKAGTIIVEPIMDVSIEIPKECYGDIQGDLMSRRGRPLGMEEKNSKITILNAKVPEVEMYQYINTLRSITGGTGTYKLSFSHFERVPEKEEQALCAAFKAVDEDE